MPLLTLQSDPICAGGVIAGGTIGRNTGAGVTPDRQHSSRSSVTICRCSSAASKRRSVPLRRSLTRTQNHRTRDASDMTGSRAKPPIAMNAPLIY